jgi:hypothetical protein
MQTKEDKAAGHPPRAATRTAHARPRRADHPDHPDPYRSEQLAIWAVAEANRRRCAHRA